MGAGQAILWSGRARNPWLAILVGAPGVFLLFWPHGLSAIPRYVLGPLLIVVGTTFASVAAEISATTLSVLLGPLRWPRFSIPLAEVAEARVEQLKPRRLGGWGYRMCGRRCWAVVIRAGEALVVTRHDGRTRKITVDHADTALPLLDRSSELN